MIDGTLETIDVRPALRFERALPHPVERVWRAISDPAELEQWFPAAADWKPAPGESLDAHGMSGEVTTVEAPTLLAWDFNGERFKFELAADGEGCRLTFVHVFADRALAAQHASGWNAYFTRLDAHLDGGFLSEEDAHQGWDEVHERFAERFGVDPEPGRRFWADYSARVG